MRVTPLDSVTLVASSLETSPSKPGDQVLDVLQARPFLTSSPGISSSP